MVKKVSSHARAFRKWFWQVADGTGNGGKDPLTQEYLSLMGRVLRVGFLAGAVIAIGAGIANLYYYIKWGEVGPESFWYYFGIPFMSAVGGSLIIAWVAGLIYVYKDSKRRNMAYPGLWVLICMLVPYLVGFLVYFLLRRPLPVHCPQCRTLIPAGGSFCPGCGHSAVPLCPNCNLPVTENSRFCASCGTSLTGMEPEPEKKSET